MSPSSPRSSYSSSLKEFAEKLPFLHPPTPRGSRDWSRESRTSIGLPTPASVSSGVGSPFIRGHRRQLSLSSFTPRKLLAVIISGIALLLLIGILSTSSSARLIGDDFPLLGGFYGGGRLLEDDGSPIPLGQSRMKNGQEIFWWQQFQNLVGYYGGRKTIVPMHQWVSEQKGGYKLEENPIKNDSRPAPPLIDVTGDEEFEPCYFDDLILPPRLLAYEGLPQGFPAPLLGSHDEIGLRGNVCYDRVNRFGNYGYGSPEEEGGLNIPLAGDLEGRVNNTVKFNYKGIKWDETQKRCTASKRYQGPRTVFIIRTWHDFQYTQYHILMLRAIISELTLGSGGKYTVHFLIHVRDDSIPIWASEDVYDQILDASLPDEFKGMGSLWSVAQMKLIYPPPFAESISNFSGEEIYKAYRSLHFPLQYFAQLHPEFEYLWHWEMDIRVTGSYIDLLEQVTKWSEKQERDFLWEKSAKFYIPSLFDNSYPAYINKSREEFGASVKPEASSSPDGTGEPVEVKPASPISGPQLPEPELLFIPGITDEKHDNKYVDLITFSPIFNPEHTRWAFHNDITGYQQRPPTRASLITASRLSRRLLVTMHHETFTRKHTMFPEMFPASIALHYGYKAVYAPLPVYFDRNWPAEHAEEVFNNAPISEEARKSGMDHGAGHFHGQNGSVFGPGEHVFRGSSWYSNAWFSGYLWHRWLGVENRNDEIAWESVPGRGRMCLPMMVLHPVKSE